MSEELIGPKELLESGSSFITTLYETSQDIINKRLKEAELRLIAKQKQDDLSFALTDATLEISAFMGAVIDPSTGKSNKDYTALKTRKELDGHGIYKEAETAYLEANSAHAMAQAELRNSMDVFTAVRGGANIVAAMLYFLSDNRPAIVVKESSE